MDNNNVSEALVDKIKDIDISKVIQEELIESYKTLKYIESLFYNLYCLNNYYEWADVFYNSYKEWRENLENDDESNS